MPGVSLPRRLAYTFLGYLYWLAHQTESRRLLGLRYSTLVKLSAVALVFLALAYRWGEIALYLAIGLLAWVFLAYWLAGRAGYFRFVPVDEELIGGENASKLPPYQRVPVTATGTYSLQSWEKNVLFRPAAYWQVPRGDHAVMVEHQPYRYLYQFFNAQMVEEFRCGWLIYGPHPSPAISVSFLSIWGPEYAEVQYSIFGSEPKPVEPKMRTIYFSFAGEEEERIVYQNIIHDLQQARSTQQAAD